MPLRVVFTSLLLLLLPAIPATAGGDPKNKASISFHIETEPGGNPKMVFPQLVSGQTRYFIRVPEVTIKDIASYTPFPAENGEGFGFVIRLKPKIARRISSLTNLNQQRWMIAMVNGRVIDGVVIDKQIDDGVLVVWKGANLEDVALIDKSVTRTGAEGEKNKKN